MPCCLHKYSLLCTCCYTLSPQEYADGADLFTVLQRYGGRLSERVAVQMVLDPFIRVLDYLHSRGIIHRDIKVRTGKALRHMPRRELKVDDVIHSPILALAFLLCSLRTSCLTRT